MCEHVTKDTKREKKRRGAVSERCEHQEKEKEEKEEEDEEAYS